MAVRSQHNRYREEPWGHDFNDVLKRGKVFHRASGEFDMIPFTDSNNNITDWMASRVQIGFRVHEGTRRFVFNVRTKRWEEFDI